MVKEEIAFFRSRKTDGLRRCFAVALTRLRKAELYTGEFRAVEEDVKIVWL